MIRCANCGKIATCIGAYEGITRPMPACDDCCGHGNEDGWCSPIKPPPVHQVTELLERVAAELEGLRGLWRAVDGLLNSGNQDCIWDVVNAHQECRKFMPTKKRRWKPLDIGPRDEMNHPW